MLTDWRDRSFADLLAEHGLTGLTEREFPTDGWSGARFTMIERGRDRFVVKRTSLARDWIASATDDVAIREACVAASVIGGADPFPYLGAAADGDEAAILMPDLSVELLEWDRPAHAAPLGRADVDRVLAGLAQLHQVAWPGVIESAGPFPWTPLPERLLLTSRPMCARHIASGIPSGIASAERLLAGWDAFDRRAPPLARALVTDLSADVAPLVRALARLPSAGLHGDLKLANAAVGPDDRIRFIDWSMTIQAPVAVELGWFLVSNSGSLPVPPDEVLERYRLAAIGTPASLDELPRPGPAVIADWEAQVDLAMVVGLLLRGFRKGLDTEAGITLASGVTAGDDLAWWCERSVAASARLS